MADEITTDYTSLFGGEPVTQSSQALVGSWAAFLPGSERTRRSFSTEGLRVISYKAIFLQASFDVFERHRRFVSTRGNHRQVVEIFQQLLVLMDGKKDSRFPAFGVYDELCPRNAHGSRPPRKLHRLWNHISPAGPLLPPDRVARIDPESGAVTGWLDLSSIAERERRAGEADVANGIARNGRTLYVTGKLWRSVYGLELLR